MEVTVDLDPAVVQLLDIHRAAFNIGRSDFLNYIIALYDQNTRQHHQQVRQVQYHQPAYQQPIDDSGYLGPVDSSEPEQNVRQYQLHRQSNATLRSVLHGNTAPRGTRPKNTVVKAQSKTLPKKTRW